MVVVPLTISFPKLELHSRAVPSVKALHRVSGHNTGRNSGGRLIIKKQDWLRPVTRLLNYSKC